MCKTALLVFGTTQPGFKLMNFQLQASELVCTTKNLFYIFDGTKKHPHNRYSPQKYIILSASE